MNLLFPIICLVACVLCIVFESRERSMLAMGFKLLASFAFIGFAWQSSAWQSVYGKIILTGLVLSLLGDGLLALKGNKNGFIAGIAAFLLAHVFYSIAFFQTGFASYRLPLVLPAVLVFVLLTILWLRAHLSGVFVVAVPLYLLAISMMLVFAWCNQASGFNWLIVIGASLFAVSDLFVARNRFISAQTINRIVGLPIYYVAQLILAFTVTIVN